MELVQFLFVGLVAGWVMGKIVRGKGFGLFGNIAIGAIGSLIGGYLFGFLGVQVHNTLGAIVMAVVGAIVLFLVLSLFRSGFRKEEKEGEE